MELPAYQVTKRFWTKVEILTPDECWNWQGSLRGDSYGQFYAYGKHRAVHRFSHFIATLEWPPVVRHKCDNRTCVNPHHLEGGTQTDNMRDVIKRGRHRNANKTHCPYGHTYDTANTYTRPNGSRECRQCRRDRKHETHRMALPEMWHTSPFVCDTIPNSDTPLC